jgi:hypothetical protein
VPTGRLQQQAQADSKQQGVLRVLLQACHRRARQTMRLLQLQGILPAQTPQQAEAISQVHCDA